MLVWWATHSNAVMEFILTVLKSLGYRKARKQQLFYYELICIFFCLSVEQYFFFCVAFHVFSCCLWFPCGLSTLRWFFGMLQLRAQLFLRARTKWHFGCPCQKYSDHHHFRLLLDAAGEEGSPCAAPLCSHTNSCSFLLPCKLGNEWPLSFLEHY